MYVSIGGPAIFLVCFSGLYYFSASFSGLEEMFGAVIRVGGQTVSSEAYISAHGSATTSATVVCRAGEYVSVVVTSFGDPQSMVTYRSSRSLMGFTGYLIVALDIQ